jgi:GLPGLI family protein
MKTLKQIGIITMLLSVFVLNAQNFQGKAYYQTKRTFEMKMDSSKVNDEMQKQIQEMIRTQFEKTYILTFNKNESIYKQEEKLNKPNPAQGGFVIEIVDGHNILYKNNKDSAYTQSLEEFGKKFLIQDKLKPLKWEMTKESKMIGKYLCIKATATKLIDDYDDEFKKKEKQKKLKIEAWYTPEIPVGHGPEMYGNLPGLILELHEDKMHYVCNKIVLNPKEKVEITAPKKGKKINQKDFDKMMDKKNKEMMEQFKNNRKKGDKSDGFTITIGG